MSKSLSNIDKQALCVPEREKHYWGKAVMHSCDFCGHYAMTITTVDGEHSCANCCNAEYVCFLTRALEMAKERAEATEKRNARALELLNAATAENAQETIGRLMVVISGDYRSDAETTGKGQ